MFLAFIRGNCAYWTLAAGLVFFLGRSDHALASEPPSQIPVAETVTLHIVATNADAVDVFVNGKSHGVTPADIKLPRSNKAITMSFRKQGYWSKELRVTPHRARTIKIKLLKIPPPPRKKDPRENLPF